MKFRMILLSLCLTGALTLPALGASVKDSPGYVDLSWIRVPTGAAEIQDIDLDPMLVGLAAQAKSGGDEAMGQALRMIKSVRVKSFSLAEKDVSAVEADVAKVLAKLERAEWKRLIYVKDGDETVSVSTRYVGDDMVGLMLVAYEPGDSATFVNVVGDLDLATLLQLAGNFKGEGLEEMLSGLGAATGSDQDGK